MPTNQHPPQDSSQEDRVHICKVCGKTFPTLDKIKDRVSGFSSKLSNLSGNFSPQSLGQINETCKFPEVSEAFYYPPEPGHFSIGDVRGKYLQILIMAITQPIIKKFEKLRADCLLKL